MANVLIKEAVTEAVSRISQGGVAIDLDHSSIVELESRMKTGQLALSEIEDLPDRYGIRQEERGAFLAEVWQLYGVCFLESHKAEKAVEALDNALSFNEEDPKPWELMGIAFMDLGRFHDAIRAFDKSHSLPEYTPKEENLKRGFYGTWVVGALAMGVDALLTNNIRAFEEAGLKFIDILEKAEQDEMSQVVEDVLAEFKAGLKKKRELKALEELVLYIDLMKIKDPFEGWRAIGRVVSERWPKGLDCVKAVRAIRR